MRVWAQPPPWSSAWPIAWCLSRLGRWRHASRLAPATLRRVRTASWRRPLRSIDWAPLAQPGSRARLQFARLVHRPPRSQARRPELAALWVLAARLRSSAREKRRLQARTALLVVDPTTKRHRRQRRQAPAQRSNSARATKTRRSWTARSTRVRPACEGCLRRRLRPGARHLGRPSGSACRWAAAAKPALVCHRGSANRTPGRIDANAQGAHGCFGGSCRSARILGQRPATSCVDKPPSWGMTARAARGHTPPAALHPRAVLIQ